jgi:hypothetical protein
MAEDAMSLLQRAIESDDGVGCFYICAKNFLTELKLIQSARDASLHSGAGDFNYEEVDARDIQYAAKFGEALRATPIAAKRSILIVKCADRLKAGPRMELDLFLKYGEIKDLLLLLFNTPHSPRDEEIAQDERITLIECD